MLSLLWKFLGDNSPIKKAMADTAPAAKQSGSEIGKVFGSQFKASVMRFIGAGALIGLVQKQMADAVKLEGDALRKGLGVEAMQELEEATRQTGLTLAELQKVAPSSGAALEKFARLMESIRAAGGIVDEKTVKQLADVADSLRQITRQVAPVMAAALKIISAATIFGMRLPNIALGGAAQMAGTIPGLGKLAEWGQARVAAGQEGFIQGITGLSGSPIRARAREFMGTVNEQGGVESIIKELEETNRKLEKLDLTVREKL